MNDGNTGKLYFLRDRGRRPAPRPARKRPEGPKPTPGERRRPSAQETVWLGRVFFVEAAYLILYWVAVGTDVMSMEASQSLGLWLYSFLPADAFVVVAAGIAGYDLAYRGGKRDIFVLLAAGGMIFLSLERLGYRIVHSHPTPGERLEITAMGIWLCVAVWAVSHSFRQRAER